MALKLPAVPNNPDTAAALRYLAANAAERRPEIRRGAPGAGEGEDGVPFWRVVAGVPKLYVRLDGVLWSLTAAKES